MQHSGAFVFLNLPYAPLEFSRICNSRMVKPYETTSVGRSTIIAGWTLTTLALLLMLIQIWTRLKVDIRISAEDYLVCISLLISLGSMSLTTWAVIVQGQGQHMVDESHSQFEMAAKVHYTHLQISEITDSDFYVMVVSAGK